MNAAIGINGWVIQVEGVTVVGEVNGVRHRRVIELAGNVMLYLAANIERATRGFLTTHASRHSRGDIRNLAAVLQPGAATVKVNANLRVSRARATVELVSAALCFCLACCSLRTSLFSSNALSVGASSGLAGLACFLILLCNQAWEEELYGAVHCGLDVRRQLWGELLCLVQNLVAGIPGLLPALAVEVIQLLLCLGGEVV